MAPGNSKPLRVTNILELHLVTILLILTWTSYSHCQKPTTMSVIESDKENATVGNNKNRTTTENFGSGTETDTDTEDTGYGTTEGLGQDRGNGTKDDRDIETGVNGTDIGKTESPDNGTEDGRDDGDSGTDISKTEDPDDGTEDGRDEGDTTEGHGDGDDGTDNGETEGPTEGPDDGTEDGKDEGDTTTAGGRGGGDGGTDNVETEGPDDGTEDGDTTTVGGHSGGDGVTDNGGTEGPDDGNEAAATVTCPTVEESISNSVSFAVPTLSNFPRPLAVKFNYFCGPMSRRCQLEVSADGHMLRGLEEGPNMITISAEDTDGNSATCRFTYTRTEETISVDVLFTLRLVRAYSSNPESEPRQQLRDDVQNVVGDILKTTAVLGSVSEGDVGITVVSVTATFTEVPTRGRDIVSVMADLRKEKVELLKDAVASNMLGSEPKTQLELEADTEPELTADKFYDIRFAVSGNGVVDSMKLKEEDWDMYERYKQLLESAISKKLESDSEFIGAILQMSFETDKGIHLVFFQAFYPPSRQISANDIREKLLDGTFELPQNIKLAADSITVTEPLIATRCYQTTEEFTKWDTEQQLEYFSSPTSLWKELQDTSVVPSVILAKGYSRKKKISVGDAFAVNDIQASEEHNVVVKVEWKLREIISGLVILLPTWNNRLTYEKGPDELCYGSYKFKAPRPTIQKVQYNNAVTAAVVTFDLPVEMDCRVLIRNFPNCITCRWMPKSSQLSLDLTDPECDISPDEFSLEFDQHSLESAGQDYMTEPTGDQYQTITVQEPADPDPPHCEISSRSGSIVQACSNEEDIVLRANLRGGGVFALDCMWSVTTEADDSQIKFKTVSDTYEKGGNEHKCLEQTIMKSWLNEDALYTFQLKVSTRFDDSYTSPGYGLTVSSEPKPQLKLFLNGAPRDRVLPGKEISVTAEVEFPTGEGCLPSKQVEYSWEGTENNGDTLDFSNPETNRRMLVIPANTLPAVNLRKVTISCKVKRAGDEDDKSSQASMELTMYLRDLVANIRGGEERVIGVDSSTAIELNGAMSVDPDIPSKMPTFLWSCETITPEDETVTDPGCPLTKTTSKVAMFDPSSTSIYVGTYKVIMVVSKEERSDQQAMVIVNVRRGSPPQVDFIPMDTEYGCYPASTSISIAGSITVKNANSAVTVTISDSSGMELVPTLKGSGNIWGVSTFIDRDKVTAGREFVIQFNVNDGSGATDGSDVTIAEFYAPVCMGVSGCQATIGEYNIGKELPIEITNCQILNINALPLSYTVFLSYTKEDDSAGFIQVTQAGTEPVITGLFMGKPPDIKKSTMDVEVIVQVDDQFGSMLIMSETRAVKQPVLGEKDKTILTEKVNGNMDKANYAGALGPSLVAASIPSTSRKRKRRKRATDDWSNIFNVIAKLTDDIEVLSGSELQMTIDSTAQIELDGSANDEIVLSSIDAQLGLLESFGLKLRDSSAQNLLDQIFSNGDVSSFAWLNEKRPLIYRILKDSALDDSVGNKHTFHVGGMCFSTHTTWMSDTISPCDEEFSVKFGDELSQMYDTNARLMTGMQVINTAGGPSACPVGLVNPISVELYDEGGTKKMVADLNTPVEIFLPSAPSSCLTPKTCMCVYCDPASKKFSKTGVYTVLENNIVICQTRHLSEFNLVAHDGSVDEAMPDPMTSPDPVTTKMGNDTDDDWDPLDVVGAIGLGIGVVFGIIIGVLVAIIILIVVVVVVIKKSNKG